MASVPEDEQAGLGDDYRSEVRSVTTYLAIMTELHSILQVPEGLVVFAEGIFLAGNLAH